MTDDSIPDFLRAAIECANHTYIHNKEKYDSLAELDIEVRRDYSRRSQHNLRIKRKSSHFKYAPEIRGKLRKKHLLELRSLQDDRCGYCGISLKGDYHIDHIVPVNSGGQNDIDNLLLACAACNLSKSDRELSIWVQKRGW